MRTKILLVLVLLVSISINAQTKKWTLQECVSHAIENNITGYIVEDGNINAMADSIEKFIIQPDLIVTMGLEARSYIENYFNNSIQSQKLMDLYKQ